LSIASKRRQGGKVETHSNLVSGREDAELEEVVIAIARGERNQEQQGAGEKGCPSLAIRQPRGGDRNWQPREAYNICHERSQPEPTPIT
jgi:hypothetical protein